MIGSRIGHYEITAEIGRGGMGEVYRARDTKLNRDVALKILPQVFAQDAERMARFEREAQVLASLNHTNIAQIYGLETRDSGPGTAAVGCPCLVLELVEGETLQEQIARGPIPVDESLKIALQICEGLEAAHEKGIIHRDLKPANIKITPEGQVKILDFGLAKAMEDTVSSLQSPASGLSHSPTITHGATQAGMILGTAAYMSPEQARGQPVDKRTDIWAFGCVLYEMLTGKKAFGGEDVSDTVARVLRDKPNWKDLAGHSPAIVELLKRSLRKDSSVRLRDIRDLRLDLTDSADRAFVATEVTTVASSWRARFPWLVALLISFVAILTFWNSHQVAEEPPKFSQRLSLNLPHAYASAYAPTLALSPNGRHFVFVALEGNRERIYRRDIDLPGSSLVEGTEGARRLFFSPDSEWVGFYANGQLQKVSLRGGTPMPICALDELESIQGASWGPDGQIIFGSLKSGLSEVSASGGVPRALTVPDRDQTELGHLWPTFLPGSEAVLFTVWHGSTYDQASIAVLSLKTGQWDTLIKGGSYPRYSPTGHLLYAFSETLMAVKFDLEELRIKGDPVPVLDGITINPRGVPHFDFSNEGMLVYWSRSEDTSLVWIDGEGQAELASEQRRRFHTPRISPDARHVSVSVYDGKTKNIYLMENPRGVVSPLTFNAISQSAIWTPDGQGITFAGELEGRINLFQIPADGSGNAERLTQNLNRQDPCSWSPDGEVLMFQERNPETNWDLWLLWRESQKEPRRWLDTPFSEKQAVFSPDGEWIAFTSDRSGQEEVYLRSFSGEGGVTPVSTEGGSQPIWDPDGSKLYYLASEGLMAVMISLTPVLRVGKPEVLIKGRFVSRDLNDVAAYDISPNGRRFLMVREGERSEINVVLNWFEELKRLVPTE